MSESNGFVVSPFLDGYDLEFLIPAAPGRWPDVRIRYRPLSADEESRIFALKNLNPTEPIVKFYAEAFCAAERRPAKLMGWDLKDRQGNLVPISPENIGKLTPQFFDALKMVIDGSVITDTGEKQAEADVKNS